MIEKYYCQIIKNFNSKKIFYCNSANQYTYKQLGDYVKGFIRKFPKNTKQRIFFTYADKSFESYAVISAILLNNDIWVPISPNWKNAQIKEITNLIKPDFFLTNKKIHGLKINQILYKNIKPLQSDFNFKNLIKKINYNYCAFIYFTSGSTGEPKGVKITHENFIYDFFLQKKNLYKEKNDNLIFADLHDTAFSIFFDIFFPALYFKSKIIPSTNKFDNFFPIKLIQKYNVNTLITVPSTIQRISDFYKKLNLLNKFQYIMITGEIFYLTTLDYIFKNFKSKKIYNVYGSTELSNWVFYHRCKINDLKTFQKFNLVPIGIPFEKKNFLIKKGLLYIKGKTVSQGYLKNKQNNGVFYFKKNLRIYKTGDNVKKFKSKLLVIGRNSQFIKVRGYRVSLSLIEAKIKKCPLIKNCIVFEKIDKSKNYKNYIVAIVQKNRTYSEKKFISFMKSQIEDYCIPKKIIYIKKFILNTNGKVDRNKTKKELKLLQ